MPHSAMGADRDGQDLKARPIVCLGLSEDPSKGYANPGSGAEPGRGECEVQSSAGRWIAPSERPSTGCQAGALAGRPNSVSQDPGHGREKKNEEKRKNRGNKNIPSPCQDD